MAGKIEWRTLALIGVCHGLWLAGGLAWTSSNWVVSVVGLLMLAPLAAFHTSLQHETIHGHPTRFGWLNELLISLPLAVVFPYRRYRDLHLQHHNDLNLTDPYEDPESYFWPLCQYTTMRPIMRKLFLINNTLVGRLVIGPWLTLFGFARTEICRIRAGEPGVRLAWLLHVVGLVAMGWIITNVFAMPLWIYVLCVVYPALSLTALRSYAEHQAAENVGARSAIVEAHPFFALLYLNNNLHIVHHANPAMAWYDLPCLYRERRDLFLAANEHTLFNGYGDILRRFAFRVKQPVDHPLMYREESQKVIIE
ncbi:MAG: fatty acid desaturase [Rhizobiaceae bacterium]